MKIWNMPSILVVILLLLWIIIQVHHFLRLHIILAIRYIYQLNLLWFYYNIGLMFCKLFYYFKKRRKFKITFSYFRYVYSKAFNIISLSLMKLIFICKILRNLPSCIHFFTLYCRPLRKTFFLTFYRRVYLIFFTYPLLWIQIVITYIFKVCGRCTWRQAKTWDKTCKMYTNCIFVSPFCMTSFRYSNENCSKNQKIRIKKKIKI